MPAVYPFRAVQYAGTAGVTDVSPYVAPPYDVLDAGAKARLLARDPKNIVAIDLPHLPAKELGPPEAYAKSGATLREWLAQGVLRRADTPAMFVYRQTFETAGKTHQRTGMACTVQPVAFGPRAGGGVLAHEETFTGPKEDRLALMKSTRCQLSPIFSLHQDESGAAAAILQRVCASRAPDITANMGDGVLHEIWNVHDNATISAYQQALAGEDLFIADGHHRYTTSINYLRYLEESGPVPADHPARRRMMVLISMNDPGLVIWPTHRVLAGMEAYSFDRFKAAAANHLTFEPVSGGLQKLDAILSAPGLPGRMGLYDFATGASAIARPSHPDPLEAEHGYRHKAWRALDVAIVQHLIVEQICQPELNAGHGVKWAFPHTIAEIEAIGAAKETGAGGGKGFSPQLAIVLRPAPLEAIREVSRAGELMPQKSTFFYPKLATGLFINPVE